MHHADFASQPLSIMIPPRAVLCIISAASLLIGCASTQPPTKLETTFYVVATNVVALTNMVPERWFATNSTVDPPIVTTITNFVPLIVYQTNYTFMPNATAQNVQAGATAIGGFWGYGELAGLVLGLLFGLYGTWRSAQTRKTAQSLVQAIETARAVLQQTPQGKELDMQFKAWLQKHQAEAGVADQVLQLLATVSPGDAAAVADKIRQLIGTK